MKTKTILFRVSEAEENDLRAAAMQSGESVSFFIRKAIKERIKEMNDLTAWGEEYVKETEGCCTPVRASRIFLVRS